MRKCPICASQKVHKKGKRKGKQRYRCSDCFNNFSGDNKGVQQSNQFIWFRKWIMERQVFALAQVSYLRSTKIMKPKNLLYIYQNTIYGSIAATCAVGLLTNGKK